MRIFNRTLLWVCAGVAIAVLAGAAAVAGSTARSFIATADSQEHQAFVDGDSDAVAQRLPKQYTAVTDSGTGKPLLFARVLDCKHVTLDGQAAPATMASF